MPEFSITTPVSSRYAGAFALALLVWLNVALAPFAHAAESLPLLTVTPGAGGQVIGVSGEALPFVLLFPFLPALLFAFSAFARIAVVLFLLRAGLGNPHAPPTLVLTGLALLLTFFVMTPAIDDIHKHAYTPYLAGTLAQDAALDRASAPLKTFMLRQTRQEDLDLFTEGDVTYSLKAPAAIPMRALAPAFLTSELKTAFQIGFMVILPFLVIDLVVAAVLTALGVILLPPQAVALPLKLLLFVAVDGWHLLVGSLVGSF
jgi:flagellar biosynthetic protein FliP